MQTYFLPIKSFNLVHYFQKGCICPALYIEKRHEDIQTRFPDTLLLSDNKFTDNTDCALEMILTEKERQLLERQTSVFYFLSKPLPISRVKKVIFSDRNNSINTCFDINNGAAFLPESLIEIEEDNLNPKKIAEIAQLTNVGGKRVSDSWHEQIDRFNRVLGGFALLQAAKNDVEDYPLSYFSTLSLFNKKISHEFNKLKFATKSDYEWLFTQDDEQGRFQQIRRIIYKQITASVVEAYADHEKVILTKNWGKYDLANIDDSTMTYTLATLASYDAIGARMTLDNFISGLRNDQFSIKKREPLALTFGINKGYFAFRNNYETSNFNIDIKFRLNSQLDYYTIESIYQFVFNSTTNSETFDYLDSWCPKFKLDNTYKDYETYRILDKTIRFKKKQPEPVFFESIYQNCSQNGIYLKLANELSRWYPPYLTPAAETTSMEYFKEVLEPELLNYTKEICEKANFTTTNPLKDELIQLRISNAELQNELVAKDLELMKLRSELEQTNRPAANNTKKPVPAPSQQQPKLELAVSNTEQHLQKQNTTTLQNIAKDNRIKGRSRLNKAVLITAIMNAGFQI